MIAPGPSLSTLASNGGVLIVGTGLIGASLGLALTARAVPVRLQDASPAAQALARDIGAGEIAAPDDLDPALVVIAAPPDVTADLVAQALGRYPDAAVIDVAGVKSIIEIELSQSEDLELHRYLGSHPMAGRERHGPAAADGDLFAGRPWVLTPNPATDPQLVNLIRGMVQDIGASPVEMSATDHDHAVALVSHLPQLLSSLAAVRLVDAPEGSLALAGQGLRDVTRIAASDARLWASILVGNATPVRDALLGVRADLDSLLQALDAAGSNPLAVGSMSGIARIIAAGNTGVARIPGKHGGARKDYAAVTVLVPDRPGELGRLFSEIGEIGVNIEDFHMDHSPQQKVGMATVSVIPSAAAGLVAALEQRQWRVVVE
ncbi:MAG: prephenate dehydrogenase [Beutenbergiaceae bacterium]